MFFAMYFLLPVLVLFSVAVAVITIHLDYHAKQLFNFFYIYSILHCECTTHACNSFAERHFYCCYCECSVPTYGNCLSIDDPIALSVSNRLGALAADCLFAYACEFIFKSKH